MHATFPICFSSLADWERWRKSRPACDTHCRDCLPAYQMRMKTQGRCEHPEVMFTVEEDGVVGA